MVKKDGKGSKSPPKKGGSKDG
jgi:hypothetical protein